MSRGWERSRGDEGMRACGNTNGLGKLLPPEAVPHLPSPHPLISALERHPHSRRECEVVRRLAADVERGRVLHVELADVVLRHQADAEVLVDREVRAEADVAGEVRRLRRADRLRE